MHEITNLNDDYEFLKKYEALHNNCKSSTLHQSKKDHIRTNFVLHPKRLSSESECLSRIFSPRKFCSTTVTKHTDFQDNNGLKAKVLDKLQTERTSIEEIPYVEPQLSGDNNCKIMAFAKSSSITESFNTSENIRNPNRTNIKKKLQNTQSTSSRIDNNFDKKFRNLIERTIRIISDIRNMMTKGIEPCYGEDLMRKTKRAQEFSSRFSRIYLYPLIRHMTDLNGQDQLSRSVINQKIVQAHHLIFQGVQAYLNYLSNAVGNCCSDKLRSLLDQTVYLCQIHCLIRKNGRAENDEFVNALQSHSELLLETINTFEIKFIENKNKINDDIEKKKLSNLQPKLRSRLSMYAVTASFRKDADWRKAVEALAKKKYNVKSRYKTASFKHRPPVEKPHIMELPSKVRLFPKRSSGILKSTPLKSPINEDELQTMVGLENELQVPANSTEVLNHENSSNASDESLQLVRAGDSDLGMTRGKQEVKLEKALEVLRICLDDAGRDGTKLLEKITGEVENKKSQDGELKECKLYKKPFVTITGAKNARLICIKDDNSLVEVTNDEETSSNEKILEENKLKSSETQTEVLIPKKTFKSDRTRSTIKISRLPKNYRILKLLPKEYAINIIQYKLQYHNFQKPNPMYRKSTTVQPWILMGQISDQMLNYILEAVTGELEVNKILENLYNAEFQY